MKTTDIDIRLIEGYIKMLENLSPGNKLDLISKLTQSVKADISDRNAIFYKAFGAWDSKKSAEEMINEINASRTFKRNFEQL